MGIKVEAVESKETVDNNRVSTVKKELPGEDCSKCLELQEIIKNAEEKCALLHLEMARKKSEYDLLEKELRVLKESNKELKGKQQPQFVDLTEETDDQDRILQLLIENKVLDCEKRKAEQDAQALNVKCKELEMLVMELQKSNSVLRDFGTKEDAGEAGARRTERVFVATTSKDLNFPYGIDDQQRTASTPQINTPEKQVVLNDGLKLGLHHQTASRGGCQVRRQLAYTNDMVSIRKIAPLTPAAVGSISLGLIDINDSDDERNTTVPALDAEGPENACTSTPVYGSPVAHELPPDNEVTGLPELPSDIGVMPGYCANIVVDSTPKRRRPSNMICSDTESDYGDDDSLTSILSNRRRHEAKMDEIDANDAGDEVGEPVPRSRLKRLRKCEEKDVPEGRSTRFMKSTSTECQPGIRTYEIVFDDDEMEGNESESEGESLGGFIVSSSDSLESDYTCDGDGISDSGDVSGDGVSLHDPEDISDSNLDYDGILSKLRRKRDSKSKWEFEADMLADFGKDPELCMKAVCALYRQQTSEEKFSKGTIFHNQRGFSQCDALRGSNLAEFLTDGDPQGDVRKSAKELQEFDPKGLELCRRLATHYSRQLFEIYKNKEDPLFLPS